MWFWPLTQEWVDMYIEAEGSISADEHITSLLLIKMTERICFWQILLFVFKKNFPAMRLFLKILSSWDYFFVRCWVK